MGRVDRAPSHAATWNCCCAVISSQPTSPGVSMRPAFVSRVVGAPFTDPSIPPGLNSGKARRMRRAERDRAIIQGSESLRSPP